MPSSKEIGNKYELKAEKFLESKGYKILEKNFSCTLGEIDIICENEEYIIFVEVKYRKSKSFGYPREAVSTSKQKKIIKTSLNYIMLKEIKDRTYRYDVIEILNEKIEHIQNAFCGNYGWV